ncbi:NUDIX domain-containing protein [Winogradskyella sp.]|uniref:NUDIX domain-containing protein n=1 Tax=Winogradskyella sp. TaxID=1883156 RepID=UPI00263965ED|nr:NUDIX domain-containing protein [Winogradskyella sp.]
MDVDSFQQEIKYCSRCGSKIEQIEIDSAGHMHHICLRCDAVFYDNPKIIVNTLIECNNKILLCKRAVKPKIGFWTLPGGYMESNETTDGAAIRETKEETGVDVKNLQLYALFNCPAINQVYFIFRGHVHNENTCTSEETSEVKYFSECDIPWENLSYGLMRQVLDWYFQDKTEGKYRFRTDDTYEICPD